MSFFQTLRCSIIYESIGGGAGGGALQTKIGGGGGLAQHKNWQNIQSRDLFTNRFTSIALDEIICCKTFDAVRTTLPEVRQVINIRTMCEAFNKTPVTKTLLGDPRL